jgi:pseudoazurin
LEAKKCRNLSERKFLMRLARYMKREPGNTGPQIRKGFTMRKLLSAAITAAVLLAAGMASAAEIEVKMLNEGEKGAFVFVPEFVKVAPGDTVTFVSTDKGHNAETIKGMIPEGAQAFKSEMGKDFSVTLTQNGVYGIRCTPHYGMGMVAMIIVGTPDNLEAAQAVKHPGKAKKVFADLFTQQVAQLQAK